MFVLLVCWFCLFSLVCLLYVIVLLFVVLKDDLAEALAVRQHALGLVGWH